MRAFGGAKAWPLATFKGGRVINDRVGAVDVVLVGDSLDPHRAGLEARRPNLCRRSGRDAPDGRARGVLADYRGRRDRPPMGRACAPAGDMWPIGSPGPVIWVRTPFPFSGHRKGPPSVDGQAAGPGASSGPRRRVSASRKAFRRSSLALALGRHGGHVLAGPVVEPLAGADAELLAFQLAVQNSQRRGS